MRPSAPSDVVVVAAARTPIGRANPDVGWHRDVHPSALLGTCLREVVDRAGIDPALVEDVVAGCVQQIGEQESNVARNAWLEQGFPLETPGTVVNRACGSAQQAVNFAATLVAAGVHDVVIGGGVEHMGHIPLSIGAITRKQFGNPYTPEFLARYDIIGQGLGAELIAEEWGVGRAELDELGLRSHRLAHAATQEGRFEREMIPMKVGEETIATDQGIRPDTTLEALGALKPAFKSDGVITAGTSSQVSDGAAAVLLMSAEKAARLDLEPRARIVDQTTVGCDPVKMLEGPIPATAKILERNRMTVDDIDLFEVNEAFAPVIAAWLRATGADLDRTNVNGGAIALGHPLGSTGARLITTLVHELERADLERGLVTMCCGGGLGTATLIERVS